jgi:hypothetical protein
MVMFLHWALVQTGCVPDEPNNAEFVLSWDVRSFVICDDALTPCNFDYFVGLGLIRSGFSQF